MRDKRDEKKRHHFVPAAYLREFLNEKGNLRVYLKEEPKKEIWSAPENTGFRKYYYSQPIEDGARDNNTLENHFAEYEARWPSFVRTLREGRDANDQLEFFFQFLTLQMTRTPATREMVELMLAHDVMRVAKNLQKSGKLPQPPEGFEDILEKSIVTIDPHMSIHAMPKISEGFAQLLDMLGFAVVRNDTTESLITCDNPVIWFDPTVPDKEMRPHTIEPGGEVLFYFPVARDLAILGNTDAKRDFAELGLFEGQPLDVEMVKRLNRLVARFAYQTFYADNGGHMDLLEEFAEVSPTVRFDTIRTEKGEMFWYSRIFGKRRAPKKWNGP